MRTFKQHLMEKIGPVKKGQMHKDLGKSPDAKITSKDITKEKAKGGVFAKRATFAKNAKNWNHQKEEVEQIDEISGRHQIRHYPHFHNFAHGALSQNSGAQWADMGPKKIHPDHLAHVQRAERSLAAASEKGLHVFHAGMNADAGIDHDGSEPEKKEHDHATPHHALHALEKVFY